MKTTKLFAPALILAVFMAMGCQNDLSETSMSQGEVQKYLSFEGGNNAYAYSASTFFPTTITVLSVDATSITISLTFPDNRQLDVLKAVNGIDAATGKETYTDIQAEMEKFLHFYSLEDKAVADQGKSYVANPHGGELSWKVIERNGDVVRIKIENVTTATMKPAIELFIDSDKYTYANGLKTDLDGNGKPAEKWFDDFYQNIAITTGNSFTGGATGLAARNPRLFAGYSFVTFEYETNTVTVPASIPAGLSIADTAGFKLRMNISSWTSIIVDESTANYGGEFKSRLSVRKYNHTSKQWEQANMGEPSAFAVANAGYSIPLTSTVEAGDILEFYFSNKPGEEFATNGNYLGEGKQRYYASNKKIELVKLFTIGIYDATYMANEIGRASNPFSLTGGYDDVTYGSDQDGRNAYIILNASTTVTGNKGFATPGADFSKYFKLGFSASTSQISTSPDTTWNDLVFIPIKAYELRNDGLQLKVYLDPEFRGKNTSSSTPYHLNILINSGWGTAGDASPGVQPGRFGDIFQTTVKIGDEYGFVCYGSAKIPAAQ